MHLINSLLDRAVSNVICIQGVTILDIYHHLGDFLLHFGPNCWEIFGKAENVYFSGENYLANFWIFCL